MRPALRGGEADVKAEMTYKAIAAKMTIDTGILHTEDQVRMIVNRALAKLRNDPKAKSYRDFLVDSIKSE